MYMKCIIAIFDYNNNIIKKKYINIYKLNIYTYIIYMYKPASHSEWRNCKRNQRTMEQ